MNGNVTTVGTAGTGSASFYNTLDQGGNVYEWNEAVLSSSFRGVRGGNGNSNANHLAASARVLVNPTFEAFGTGFRVARSVPEPSTLLLGAIASTGLMLQRRYSTR